MFAKTVTVCLTGLAFFQIHCGEWRRSQCIKTSYSELGHQEVACTLIFKPTWPLQWDIYKYGSSTILKCCSSAAITAITWFITDLVLLTEWNQQLKDRFNWDNHSEELASSQILALISVNTANTWLTHALILNLVLLCYGESSLRISPWYVLPLFLYGPLNLHILPQNYFNRHHFFL